jgi:hypothetical protein
MNEPSKTAKIFDITWFISFVFIQALPFISPKSIQHPLSFFVFSGLLGGTMLFSKRIKRTSIVGRLLHWFALNVLKPRTEYNHIIWGLFILLFGVLSIIFHKKSDAKEIEYLNEVHKSWEFWLAVIGIFSLNILAGIFTAKKHENN